MGKILDAACGKGRHSIYLNSQGYNVTGIDLSAKSINEASKFENDSLSFFEHDIRLPFRINYFDSVFNLFTSFGYFQKHVDNMACLSNFFNALKPGGYFLFDFLNSNCNLQLKLISQLIIKSFHNFSSTFEDFLGDS
jgi:SAM-dependent methyltransferase